MRNILFPPLYGTHTGHQVSVIQEYGDVGPDYWCATCGIYFRPHLGLRPWVGLLLAVLIGLIVQTMVGW